MSVITTLSLILGLGLAVALFMWLPQFVTGLLAEPLKIEKTSFWFNLIEGFIKILIFAGYILLTSLMKDIKRTYMYHGAEHKSIACFEAGDELTPENAMKHRRFHPRCGTSFMFLMIALGIAISICIRLLVPNLPPLAYIGISLLTLPLSMGIGYEVLMIAGKHDNFLTRAISAPGLWVQRITTKEPSLDMLEIAITSIKCALRDDYPEFMEFYRARAWEKKGETAEIATIDEQTKDNPCAEQVEDNGECEVKENDD